MKNYEQMTESVFQKINEYNEAKKENAQRRRKAVGITAAAFVFVCAATFVTVAYKKGIKKTEEPLNHKKTVSVPTPTNSNRIGEEAASRETRTEEAIETTTEKVTEITMVLSEPLTRSQEVLNSENYILSKKMHDGTATEEERQLLQEKMHNGEKMYSCDTIDDSFHDDCVLVTLTSDYGGVNKVHTANEFPGIEIESIEDLTYCSDPEKAKERELIGWPQTLKITLKNKGKQEVLNAVIILEQLDYIRIVEPNHY